VCSEEVILNEERTTDEEKMKIIEGRQLSHCIYLSRLVFQSVIFKAVLKNKTKQIQKCLQVFRVHFKRNDVQSIKDVFAEHLQKRFKYFSTVLHGFHVVEFLAL